MALEDNLLQTNSCDPAPAAMSLAKAASAGAVAEAAAAAFWGEFWARSAISLPQSPEIEDYWFGAQYGTATMSASAAVLAQTKGLLPPSGLYGPWVTTDQPSWNGDFTCVPPAATRSPDSPPPTCLSLTPALLCGYLDILSGYLGRQRAPGRWNLAGGRRTSSGNGRRAFPGMVPCVLRGQLYIK